MAFFQQLRLLLWKNWLTIIRQPLWSLTLITWPLIIFIIIAVTRTNFPPVLRDTCYVEPRNLPSTGFFPFLQTLMCNTDSDCHNTSHQVDTPASKQGNTRSKRSMLENLIEGDFKVALPSDPQNNPETLINILSNVFGSSSPEVPKNVSFWNTSTAQEYQEGSEQMLESWDLLKRGICSIMLPLINTTSPSAASYSVVSFCKSNSTVFEISLQTLNQFLLELVQTKPEEMATVAGMAMLVFDQLQNQSAVWDSLLIIPKLLSSGSVDQGIDSMKSLLSNVQSTLQIIENSFPQVISPLRTVHPVLASGINLLYYAQKWPGRAVFIALGDLVKLSNDSLSDALKEILIPLDKAITLTFDKEMVRHYLCSNSSSSVWLQQSCATGVMDMLLGSTRPDLVAKQVLLRWSKFVAPQDISFTKKLLHSLMGGNGSSRITRSLRSMDAQPQNIEEELFLEVGKVLLEIIKAVPEVDMVVQRVLRSSFQSMQAATMILDAFDVMMQNLLKDAAQLQKTYLMLLSNESAAATWMSRVLDSVIMVINESVSSGSLCCEEILTPFEWLLDTESIKIEVWRTAFCQNSSSLEQALLMEWQPVVQKFHEVYRALTSQPDYNVTLPMILSEWHKLYNISRFEVWIHRLPAELGEAYWKNWMPHATHDIIGTLLQSFSISMVNFGEKIEASQCWPELKNYFHMVNWVLNYRDAATAPNPTNCQINIITSSINCDVNINWTEFVGALTRILRSSNPNFLINLLKGTVKLLQDIYSSTYRYLASSFLTKELKGGGAMSSYLINLLNKVDDFVKKIVRLPDSSISNIELMRPHISSLLQSTGLTPLMPLIFSHQPLNASAVIDAALKIGRLNQHIFTFNESDPTMPELECLIVKFLSMEDNLTVSLSHIMGHSLLTYLKYITPDDVARVRKSLEPYTNQTSSGMVEAILKAMELLKTVTDSPNGDPTHIILAYIQQLQEFVISLLRLKRTDRTSLPNGQLSLAQVTELHQIFKEFLSLLTPASLQNLIHAGPDAAQNTVIQKFVPLLPAHVQAEAVRFLQQFKTLQDKVGECAAGHNCLAGVSDIFTFLDKIVDMMLSANGSVSLTFTTPNTLMRMQQYEEVACLFFPLLLSSNDAAYVRTFRQTLHFIRLVMATQNITVSDVQNALKQSNLTIDDLNQIATLAGAANINDLIVNIMQIINARQCFEPQNNTMVTAQCVQRLANGVIGFLMHLPALRNDTAILSTIPLIVNNTISEIVQSNFSSNPTMVLVQALNVTLANVKLSLQLNNLNSPEIMNEIRVLEGLIQLATLPLPINTSFNATLLMTNPTYAQKVYLQIIDWYLKRIVAIANSSSVADLLQPFFSLTQMQVTLQLASTNFTMFVSNQVEHLINNLRFPVDGAGLHKVGLTSVAIFRRLFDLIILNLELQSNTSGTSPFLLPHNLKAAKLQVRLYLDLIEKWMKEPNVPSLLTSMLQWGNSSIDASTPIRDLHHLLQTLRGFLNNDQLSYLSIISNVTQSLSKAVMIAEQPGGLQSDQFLATILEAARTALQILNRTVTPLSLSVQHNILEIVHNSLRLILQPDMNFGSSRNISLVILKRTESVVRELFPGMAGSYMLSGLKVVVTYFQTISSFSGPDNWNRLILNEMRTIQSLLPENSSANVYISVLINITQFVLESGQGNMSIWASFEDANLPVIFVQIGRILSKLWPLLTGTPGLPTTAPSLKDFAHLAPVLEQLVTGKADKDTWDKFEKIVEGLLSMLRGTEVWDSVPTVIPLAERVMAIIVRNIQAQNAMILSLETPLVTLMKEIASLVNSSQFNVTGLQDKMQLAIELTLQAAQKANGTLICSDVLKVWKPVGAMVGLRQDALAMWCNVSMQPLIDAYNDIIHLNMSMGPLTGNATAVRIVKIIQSFYQASINHTLVTQRLIMNFSSLFSVWMGRPLSPGAQHHWYKQLQSLYVENSVASIRMLADEVLKVAPFLHPYIRAVEKAASHVLENLHLLQNNHTSEIVFREAAMIFLCSANITLPTSALNQAAIADMIRNAVKMMIDMKIFGHAPKVYQALENFLASNDSNLIAKRLTEMFAWLSTTQASGLDLLTQTLPQIYDILRPVWAVVAHINKDLSALCRELFEDLGGNVLKMFRQLISTGGLVNHGGMFEQSYHPTRSRHKRDVLQSPRDPMDDFIDLFYIDYPSMFRAMSVPPASAEIMETVHVFAANPDLKVVLNGATQGLPWGLNASREETIHAALSVFSFLTYPGTFETPSMDMLWDAVRTLPDSLPLAPTLKNISRALASESPENLILMQQALQTVAKLFQINPSASEFTAQLQQLRSQVCMLKNTSTMSVLEWSLSLKPGQLCHTLLPSLQLLIESLKFNMTFLNDAIFHAVIGDPSTYNIKSDWTSVLSQGLGFNTSSLSSLGINITSPGVLTVGEMLRNNSAFLADVQQHMNFSLVALRRLMDTAIPNNNLMILSWLVNLRHCNSRAYVEQQKMDAAILEAFCSMSVKDWYTLSVLMARHLNTEKFIYRMILSEEVQTLMQVLLHAAKVITNMMNTFLPAINQLQRFLYAIDDLNLMADADFSKMVRGQRSNIPTQATFVTLSRALCSNGILAVFGIAQMPAVPVLSPSITDSVQREEMIDRFKLPRNASPFCMNMYLDMVNTTGGAIAWAFLKPMLMGQILFSPDTPVTRAIMEKANATLNEFANLRKHSEDWIESSNYIINSAQILSQTLPMLQNSLGNSFVQNFIEMQTDINVGKMKETLSNFSNMTTLLEKNKPILQQITTLSGLMVNLSSCIKFDRYRGYNDTKELDAVAQELAKDRDLYASVIFRLPEVGDSSRKQKAGSSSSTSSLPPKVRYTIRMHMDNVMRTDRVRDPFFIKDPHISARQTLRYNRGFVYLQENIERAIIETHAGHPVAEPAVQLQPFPYPCHLRDEYLEAISYVFPLMLMMAWVLFVADFVKKLVHERELRLHEYMKMMGVNPLSHFFAWFLECATYLMFTIIILTLVLKCGRVLPNSDGFLLFLYFCDYGLSVLAFSYLISSFFDKTYIAGLSGSLIYILCFFPFIVVMAVETTLTFSQKSILSVFSPTCFSYAGQYISRYEVKGEGIHWNNMYTSPIAGDKASFGWLCWLMLIDSIIYFIIGAYVRMVFPGKYGIPAPWYFPFKGSFWADLCCCFRSKRKAPRGLLFTNIMERNLPVFFEDKEKDQNSVSAHAGENFSHLPVGVSLHGLSKLYGDRVAIQNLNISFYEGHVTTLLGHNGAGKTTTMSLLTGLFAPSVGSIEVYGKDMQTNTDEVRKELGVCMQYDVLFDHMTTKEHLLLYGQIKAPHWTRRELREQVRTILEETGMYAHRHKRVGTLSGGMKRKLSISIAFIGGSRLVVLDEPTTGVDPCSRRSIWDIVIQYKKNRTIIMSTHHLDEAEVLSDRVAFLESGGLKCCGSPFYLKDKLGQGYKLTLTKKMLDQQAENMDTADLKSFIQAHIPEARLKEAQRGDLVYSLPPFSSSNASLYRSLLTALDSNLDDLQLGGYGISDTTLEEVFLQLTQDGRDETQDSPLSISETMSDSGSIDSFPSDLTDSVSNFGDKISLTGKSTVSGVALAWQQMTAILIKRFHHSRRDWKGLIAQILLPVLFVVCAMGLGSIKNDLRHYPELELSPALYNFHPGYSFFSNQNPNSIHLVDTMMSSPGIDNACLHGNNQVCAGSANKWRSSGSNSSAFARCKCTYDKQVCDGDHIHPPYKKIPSSQILYNLTGINVENYLMTTANDFIRNRYGGFSLGMPLPTDLKLDIKEVPKNRTLSKVWYNPEGHHTMPAYLNSLNNLILRSNLPADKDPQEYAILVSSHPYFGRADDEDLIIQGMLQILVAICVLTGYSITTASFAIYEVSEHSSGSKRLQHIAGISEPFYWTVNFIYDMFMYLIPVTLTVGVIAAFQLPAFTERQNLGAVTLLLVLFGFSTFPWMYLLAGILKEAERAFITYVCINLFISVNTILSTSILYFLGQIASRNVELIQDIFKRLSHAFLIFPQFNFGNGLMQLARMDIEVQLLSGYGIDAYKNPYCLDALGWMIISSLIQGLVFFTLRLLLNKRVTRKIRHFICRRKKVPPVVCEDEDEDVSAEHQRVASGAASSDLLQVIRLTKVYQYLKRKVHAVKKLSVGIPAGECFGLLGVNGAGKTTTFKMLTGDVSPTDGTAQIRDWDGRLVDIVECRQKGINIGYCPQVDALDSLLTGEEHLYFYGRIRGISKKELDGVVSYLLKRLELDYHRNIITDGYSCGTRRKLSTALALVGRPQILLLDEPSSGMDPRTKRHLWKIISEEVKGKCAVVLTSHSMEECEALCSRLAIMVKGQFRCLGSLQHIKNRFGSGFTVKMYLAEASCNTDAITVFMQHRFPSTYLKDQHSSMVEYHVPVAPGGVADIFDQLEANKATLRIKHFSVSQTTLDEVFINFAMESMDMENVPTHSGDLAGDPRCLKEVDA